MNIIIHAYNLDAECLNYVLSLFPGKHAHLSYFAEVDIFSDDIGIFWRVDAT